MSTRARLWLSRLAYLAAASIISMATSPAMAHKASDAYLSVLDTNERIILLWEIGLRDLGLRLDLDADRDDTLSAREIAAGRPAIDALALSSLALTRGVGGCALSIAGHDFTRRVDEALIRLTLQAQCPEASGPVTIDYRLFQDTDPSHRGLLLSAHSASPSVLVPGAAPLRLSESRSGTERLVQAASFFTDGVRHILSGYDHLAFLIALLLPAALVRRQGAWTARTDRVGAMYEVAGLVTAFTLAHSITLVLGATGVLAVPPAPVEIAIAASVTLAAVNNLHPLLPRHLWLVAFVFGLIHGFGFASSLADTGLPAQGRMLALLAFNLGVEAGQLAIVLIVAPLLWLTRDQVSYRRIALPAASVALAAAGVVWIIQRTGALA
ncbi:MAG: HupE/UreJ family protein [Burkholderiaceae bacterium]|nr:HupE/UreJ family protein [Burkholderiaceae bacterium]